MVRSVDAIFTQGGFRLREPLDMPEGTRVRLSVEEETDPKPVRPVARKMAWRNCPHRSVLIAGNEK
jgi:predicted DNA-binding antitoxin AbrB/MazE fold protein